LVWALPLQNLPRRLPGGLKQLDLAGAPKHHLAGDAAGLSQRPLSETGFYLRCWAALFYDRAQRRDKTDLYAVSLDCREQFESQAYYHYAGRQNWITLHDGLPK
jgi:hypothetical protein